TPTPVEILVPLWPEVIDAAASVVTEAVPLWPPAQQRAAVERLWDAYWDNRDRADELPGQALVQPPLGASPSAGESRSVLVPLANLARSRCTEPHPYQHSITLMRQMDKGAWVKRLERERASLRYWLSEAENLRAVGRLSLPEDGVVRPQVI